MRRFLFIHQNFPAQFVHVAQALARLGHEVWALAEQGADLPGVRIARYAWHASVAVAADGLPPSLQQQFARSAVAARAMVQLRTAGCEPDVIVAHPGWGEATFAKDVWPKARLVVYAEFFYQAQGADFGFDAEQHVEGIDARALVRLKNTALLHALAAADQIYTASAWQRSLLPTAFQPRCEVAFEGVDTILAKPEPAASIHLQDLGITLRAGDEVITFVNRNLEPCRGFHVFMRALPEILARRPNARVLIVGGDGLSYGQAPPGGGTWREAMLRELGNALPMDRVHFLGVLPNAQYLKLLQVSACHVYFTYPFVMSWSAVEAMSVGCAIVASDTPPVRDFITHGEQGLLVDFFDRPALVNAVCDVLAYPERLANMRAAARQRVFEQFDLAKVCLPRQLKLLLEA